ncbi:MAG TPA: serine/threonine-protein kinase [bacterium]|nr:serine/threonine-protein kinase [bacterium]
MPVKEQTGSFEPKPFGRYVLLEKLAVGGMAEIYKAKTYGVDGFEKQLAIKRILPHCAADSEFIKMLVDEAKLTVLLSHANIVQVYDLGKVGDDYFISMEFINGTNLREVMVRQREESEKLAEEVAVYIMSEVCKGLDYAHRKTDSQGSPLNIVHRDISPQNILISFEGEVKIVDFGIAKAAMNVSHTMAGILKGKVAYMSPEQALGKPIDHRTDIFSAGVLLYEMLTGDKLFSGETQFEVLNQIRTTRINTLMLPDHIPGPLKAVLAKSLAYNVKDRYQSAGDFQLDLTKYLYSSYIDFSPRMLAGLLTKLYQSEMKRKEAPVQIDEKTRSVMIKQAETENIVVHNAAQAAPKSAMSQDTARVAETTGKVPQDTSISGLYAVPTERQKKKRPLALIAGVPVLLALVGYLGYTIFFKEKAPKPPTGITSPTEEDNVVDVGVIELDSVPPGAKVLVNGDDTGQVTPTKLSKLTLGEEYQIKLQKENYKDAGRTVAVTSEEPIKVQETLAALPKGVIEIVSEPPGAKIHVNDQDIGVVTPHKLENLEIAKTYQIKLTAPNYTEWTGTADVKDFEPVKMTAALIPVPPPVTPVVPPVTPPVTPETPTTPTVTTTPVTPPVTPVIPPVTPVTPPETPTSPTVTTTPVTPPVTPVTPPVTPQTPTTPPAPVYGKLSVTSDPPGAKVYMNGENTGRTTPTTLENLSPGKRVTVALYQKGYEDWRRTYTVEGNRTVPVYGSMKKTETAPPPETPKTPVATTPTTPTTPKTPKTPEKPYTPPPPPETPKTPVEERPVATAGKAGSISVNSDPSGADVYVNSEYKGKTPIRVSDVNPGTVRVAVSKDGYMRETQTVKLGPGENKSVGTIKLGGMFGEISISSVPPRATVIFDGGTVTKTPVTIRKVPRDQKHSIKIRLEGYRDWETSVSLSDKPNKKFEVQLEKN